MKQEQRNQVLRVGDRVTLDNDGIELFKAEMNSEDKAVQQYRKLVLAG